MKKEILLMSISFPYTQNTFIRMMTSLSPFESDKTTQNTRTEPLSSGSGCCIPYDNHLFNLLLQPIHPILRYKFVVFSPSRPVK